jgi:hypothetical protein
MPIMNVPMAESSAFEASYEALEYKFRVRTDLPRIALVADRLLRPFRSSANGRAPVYSLVPLRRGPGYGLWLGRRRLIEVRTTGGLLGRLIFEINGEAIRRTRRVMLLHAGAVAWKRQGVLLPAKRESGKTTLVAGLIRAGFNYLTDEAAVIDPGDGYLHPYPKPLSVDHPSMELLSGLRERLLPELGSGSYIQYQVPPGDLRPRAIGRPCRVRYVVFPQYSPEVPTRLSPITRAEALYTLTQNSFNLEYFDSGGVDVLADVVRDAECFRLTMRDLQSPVRALQKLIQTV